MDSLCAICGKEKYSVECVMCGFIHKQCIYCRIRDYKRPINQKNKNNYLNLHFACDSCGEEDYE